MSHSPTAPGFWMQVSAARPRTPIASEIDDDIALWLRATNQHIAGRRRIDRIGPVGDRAGHKSGFAVVTDAGAARPPRRDVARFGKFEQTLERRTPMRADTAAGERNQRP